MGHGSIQNMPLRTHGRTNGLFYSSLWVLILIQRNSNYNSRCWTYSKPTWNTRRMTMLHSCSSITCQRGSVVLSRRTLQKSCPLKSRRFLMGISIRTHSVRIWFAVLSSPIISAKKNCWIGKQSLSR